MIEFEKKLEELFKEDWIAQEILSKEELNEWMQQIHKDEEVRTK